MNKKIFSIIILGLIIVVAVYGMKRYTDSYTSKENVIKENNTIQKQEGISKDKTQIDNTKKEQEKIDESKINYYEDTDFELEDLDGNKVKLSDFKGKRVFLNFWATWCGPCKGEIPDMIELYKKTKDSDLVIVAVNIGEENKKVKKFAKENNMEFLILLDKNEEVAEKYNVSGIPTTFLIGENGKKLKWTTGAMEEYMMEDFIKEEK